MVDVFISYPRPLLSKVEPIRQKLAGLGVTSFFDTQGIEGGEQFPDAIDRGLRSAKCVLGCLSPKTFKSRWCLIECRFGLEHDKLVPVAIQRFERSSAPADLMFSNYFDLIGWKGQEDHEGWQRTLQSLAKHVGRDLMIARAPTGYDQRTFLTSLRAITKQALTQQDFEAVAAKLGCEWEALAAVAEIESGYRGAFDDEGRPIVLFERHLFSRKTRGRFDRSNPQVANRIAGGYPRELEARWTQLKEAYALDPEAALQSTSFGRFQILGQNFPNLGMTSAHEYVAKLARSERDQLHGFAGFIWANGLADELQRKDWAAFASRYNGPAYAQNQYDTKMAQAYARLKANPIA